MQQRFLIHHLTDTVQRGDSPLEEVGHPAHGHHRPRQQPQVGHEGDEVADGNGPGDGQSPSEIKDQEQAGTGDQGGKGGEYPLNQGQTDVVTDVLLPQPVELYRLASFLGVGLDQPDGRQGGTGEFGKVGELLLDPVVAFMEQGREQAGHQGQDRHGRQGQEGETGMDVGHETHGGAGHHEGVDKGDQAHAAGHLDVGEIVAGERHDLAGRVAIEKGAVQPHQPVQETVAQVAFQEAGKSQDQISPDEAEDGNAYGEGEDQDHPA